MVKIKNTTATAEQIKMQAKECMATYKEETGRSYIRKYRKDSWKYLPHDSLTYEHYDTHDVDMFIACFEDEHNLEPTDAIMEIESDIHNLKASNNKINPVTAYRICLKYWLDDGLWD